MRQIRRAVWALITCAVCSYAAADLGVEIGALHQTYDNTRLDLDNGAVHLKVRYRAMYAWASYEHPSVRLVGQRMGDVDVYGWGLGAQRASGDLRLFVEVGWFDPSASTVPGIQDEAVVTELNNNHGWRGTRTFTTTEYNLSGAYGARVGVMWDLRKHLALGASYRFLQLDEQLQAYTGDCSDWPPPEGCTSWWVENRKLDLSAAQVGVYLRF